MKTKLIICALILIIGFTGCTSSYYVTNPGYHGYKRGNYYENRYGYYDNRQGHFYRGHWRHHYGYRDLKYRRW